MLPPPLAASILGRIPFADYKLFGYAGVVSASWASVTAHPVVHGLLHVLLLQGLTPDSWLPFSSSALLGPAWSLSLEWQFYLVAPLLIGALRRPASAAAAVLAMTALLAAWRLGWLGEYRLKSSMLIAAPLFSVGIISRLVYAPLRARLRRPLLVAIARAGACRAL